MQNLLAEVPQLFRCPFCFGDLAVERTSRLLNGSCAVLRCRCGQRVPIVQQVAIFGKPAGEAVVKLLDKDDEEGLLHYIGAFHGVPPDLALMKPRTFFDALAGFDAWASEHLHRSQEGFSTHDGVHLVSHAWLEHIRFRTAMPHYKSMIYWADLIGRSRPRYVLDLASGPAHFAQAFLSYGGATRVCALNLRLFELIMARWLLDEARAVLVMANANYPLPFKDRVFDAAVSANGLYLVEYHAHALRELVRASRVDAPIALTFMRRGPLSAEVVDAILSEGVAPRSGTLLADDLLLPMFETGAPWEPASHSSSTLEKSTYMSYYSGPLVPPSQPGPLDGPVDTSVVNPIYDVTRVERDLLLQQSRGGSEFPQKYLSTPKEFRLHTVQLEDSSYRASLRRLQILVDQGPRFSSLPTVADWIRGHQG